MFYEADIVKPIVTLQFINYYHSSESSVIPNMFISNAHYKQVWTPLLKKEIWSVLLNQNAQQKLNAREKSTVFEGTIKKNPENEK
jgi:hypothetical protein